MPLLNHKAGSVPKRCNILLVTVIVFILLPPECSFLVPQFNFASFWVLWNHTGLGVFLVSFTQHCKIDACYCVHLSWARPESPLRGHRPWPPAHWSTLPLPVLWVEAERYPWAWARQKGGSGEPREARGAVRSRTSVQPGVSRIAAGTALGGHDLDWRPILLGEAKNHQTQGRG